MLTSAQPCKFFDKNQEILMIVVIYTKFHAHYTISSSKD